MANRIALLSFFMLGLMSMSSQGARIKNVDHERVTDESFEDADVVLDAPDEDNDEEDDAVKVGMYRSAIARIQANVDQLGEASKKGAEKVAVKVTDYAANVKEQAGVVGMKVLQEANMCNAQKREQVAAQMAALEAKVVQVAEMAVEKWPEVEENARAFTKQARQTVVGLMQKLGKLKMTTLEREDVQKLMKDVSGQFGRVQVMVLSNRPEYALKAQGIISDFTEKVSELSAKLMTVVMDTYEAEVTQNSLARIQAQAGQLLQAAAAKWPQVKKMMGAIAMQAYEMIKEQSARLVTFMCNPETHAKAMALVAPVVEKIGVLINAIRDYLPVIYENAKALATRASDAAVLLKARLMAWVNSPQVSAYVKQVMDLTEASLGDIEGSWGTPEVSESVQMVTQEIQALDETVATWEGTVDLSESDVEEDRQTDCFVKDVKYVPVNMKGTRRTNLDSAEECQALCDTLEGCVHFSYWPNGGCHVQDAKASARRAWNVISGPPNCDAQ